MPYVNRVPTGQFRLPERVLTALTLELTERCNSDCIHCCINRPACDTEARQRELSCDQIRAILAEAAELGCLSVRLTGGEPLLRPDFEAIYMAARRLGMRVAICTNARLITPDLADLFARIPPLEPIDISVYGMHAESYEAVSRVPGSFAQFRRGLSLLEERGVPFVVKMVVLPPNRGELPEFDRWAESLPGSRGARVIVQLHLRERRDDPAKNGAIRRLRLQPMESVRIMARDGAAFDRHMAEFCDRFAGRRGDTLFACAIGKAPSIDAYGMLQGCQALRAPALAYDLRNGSLREGVTEFLPRLPGMKASNPAYLERCARCFLRSVCDQCPARAWSETGALDQPCEYLCDLAQEQGRRLGLLGQTDKSWEVLDFGTRIEVLKERSARREIADVETTMEPAGADGYGAQ